VSEVVTFHPTQLKRVTRENDEIWIDWTVSIPAIQIAWKLGARRVLLLGIDCVPTAGRKYWYEKDGDAPGGLNDVTIEKMLREHEQLKTWFLTAPDAPEVVNLSPGSALTAWRKASIEEVLVNA
jgi:hypothetical protein